MANTDLVNEGLLGAYHDELMKTHLAGGVVFDISAYNLTNGQPTPYADLAAALGTNGVNVPEPLRKGGMSVKYVRTSDNKYVQFRFLLSGSFTDAQFANVANWQEETHDYYILPFVTDRATTRLQISEKLRKRGLKIAYTFGEEFIVETYNSPNFGNAYWVENGAWTQDISINEKIYNIDAVLEILGIKSLVTEWHKGYLNASGSFAFTNSERVSNYIPVTAGNTYYIRTEADSTSTAAIVNYNSSKEIVSVVTPTSGRIFDGNYTIPSNVAYIRINNRITNIGKSGVWASKPKTYADILEAIQASSNAVENKIAYIILSFSTDKATTRKQVPSAQRKTGVTIAYVMDDELIVETFMGNNFTDAGWSQESAWRRDISINEVNYNNVASLQQYGLNSLVEDWRAGYLKADGSYAFSYGPNRVSNFIPVTAGKTYYISADADGVSTAAIVNYDSSKGVVSVVLPTSSYYFDGYYTIPSGISYIRINRRRLTNAGVWTNKPKDLNNAILDEDITLRTGENIANPAYIFDGYVGSDGAIRTPSGTTAKCIEIPVVAGSIISFGNNFLDNSDSAYWAFYDEKYSSGGSVVGSRSQFDTNRTIKIQNREVPSGAKYVYITLFQGKNNTTSDYSEFTCNYGETLIDYIPFEEYVDKINNHQVKNYDSDIQEIKEDTAICNDFSDVDGQLYYKGEPIATETSISALVTDLPVSDGTGIESGYAYIDSTTYVIKVKQ